MRQAKEGEPLPLDENQRASRVDHFLVESTVRPQSCGRTVRMERVVDPSRFLDMDFARQAYRKLTAAP